jgi:hypothetical protein
MLPPRPSTSSSASASTSSWACSTVGSRGGRRRPPGRRDVDDERRGTRGRDQLGLAPGSGRCPRRGRDA